MSNTPRGSSDLLPVDMRERYGDPTIYECQFEVKNGLVCGYIQRGPGNCPYPHATVDGRRVGLTPIMTQPYEVSKR